MSKNQNRISEFDIKLDNTDNQQNTTEQTTEQANTETVSEELVSATQPTVEDTTPETTVENINPFQFSATSEPAKTESRKLDFTPILIDFSNRRAQELMFNQHKTRPELTPMVQKVLSELDPTDLANLLCTYFGDTIVEDASILDGCDAGQLDRLLESRRSDRSKAKAKNPAKNMAVCKTYLAAMYAELLIRTQTGKPYTGGSNGRADDLDESDLEAISKRIKSLQSKQCRLKPLAEYNEQAKKELADVMAEIARLNSLRPNTRTSAKVVVKDLSLDQIRAALKDVDPSTLEGDEAEKFYELIKKLG